MEQIDYSSFPAMLRSMSGRYGDMPMGRILDAFARSAQDELYTANPYIQNRRVKQIGSLPVQYEYNEVADMLQQPDQNEEPLREVGHVLESTAAPYFKIRKTYQDLMTCHWYNHPAELEDTGAAKKELMREMVLTDRFAEAIDIQQKAHMIIGQCVQEGKVFYATRMSLDKSHNQVNYAFLQQLPQDWTKIAGFNNVSKYTVAFDMMYFMEPGADWRQFGDLFEPYLNVFMNIAPDLPKRENKKFVYASGYERFCELKKNKKMAGNPDVYFQGGRWFYWVTLPIDRIWTFEVDDVNRNVVPPYTGLFLAMANIAKFEQVQLSLVQNPLVSMILGEIPYRDNTAATAEDSYKLSPSGRKLFEALFYQMLAENNTSGIGLYTGPFERLHLEQLAEAPSATDVSSSGYKYAMQKSGIGIIPSADDPRAGSIQISMMIESRFCEPVYRQIERMMNWLYGSMGLKHRWKFRMFGSIATDEKTEKACVQGMTLGILPDTLTYLALRDTRLTDDMAISRLVRESGLLEMRIPLTSSFGARPAAPMNKGGRPRSEGVTSEGQEQDLDSPSAAREETTVEERTETTTETTE